MMITLQETLVIDSRNQLRNTFRRQKPKKTDNKERNQVQFEI